MSFTPPPIEVGDMVLWYAEGEKIAERASPAFVLQVHGPTVSLIVHKGGRRLVYLDFCRHLDDPFWKEESNKKTKLRMGAWGYSSMLQRLADLENALTRDKNRGK